MRPQAFNLTTAPSVAHPALDPASPVNALAGGTTSNAMAARAEIVSGERYPSLLTKRRRRRG